MILAKNQGIYLFIRYSRYSLHLKVEIKDIKIKIQNAQQSAIAI